MLGIAAAYLLFAFLVVMTWYFPRYAVYIPKWLQDWMYPIDKTNMDVLRFAALHRARRHHGPVHSRRLAVAQIALAEADDSVRSALA